MKHVIADVIEERSDALECVDVAAAENGQRALTGSYDATGDRRIDVDNSGICFEWSDPLHATERVGTEVDVDVSG